MPRFQGTVAIRQTESGASEDVAVSARGANQSMEFSRTRSLGSCLQLPREQLRCFPVSHVQHDRHRITMGQKLPAKNADVKKWLDFVEIARKTALESTRCCGICPYVQYKKYRRWGIFGRKSPTGGSDFWLQIRSKLSCTPTRATGRSAGFLLLGVGVLSGLARVFFLLPGLSTVLL